MHAHIKSCAGGAAAVFRHRVPDDAICRLRGSPERLLIDWARVRISVMSLYLKFFPMFSFSLGSSLGVYIVRYAFTFAFFSTLSFVFYATAQSKVNIVVHAYCYTGNAACCCRTAAAAAPAVACTAVVVSLGPLPYTKELDTICRGDYFPCLRSW